MQHERVKQSSSGLPSHRILGGLGQPVAHQHRANLSSPYTFQKVCLRWQFFGGEDIHLDLGRDVVAEGKRRTLSDQSAVALFGGKDRHNDN